MENSRALRKLILVIAAAGSCASLHPVRAEGPDHQLPKFHEYERRASQLIRAEATAAGLEERGRAIRKMASLFDEIRRDPRLDDSDVLRSYKARLWGRLTFIKKDLEREIARREKGMRKSASPGNRPAPDPFAGDPSQDPSTDNPALDGGTRGMAASLDLVAQSLGGPAMLFARGEFADSLPDGDGARGGGTWDYGRDLVNLIQRTICPDFWDVHGGPGTIIYYAPLRCLVVRATGSVHGAVSGLLGGS